MSDKYVQSLNLNKKDFQKKKRRKGFSREKISRKYIRQKRLKILKRLALGFILLILLGLLTYFLLFSSFFQINDVEISKKEDYQLISHQEIMDSLNDLISPGIWSGRNLIFFDTSLAEKEIGQDSRLKSIRIKKKWPAKLQITLKEYQPLVRFEVLGDTQSYYLNQEGQLIKAPEGLLKAKNDQEAFNDDLVFYDQSDLILTEEDYQNFLKDLLFFVQSDILRSHDIYFLECEINNIGDVIDVQILSSEGWEILINSEVELKKQLDKLSGIIEKEIKERKGLEYIDLRFGDKIFYKFTEEK
ncbi:FtsQ-type POTRA domain-containing protein [Patescibacteria group bacterium]|nr:FtsQ-type POTRA domain-containing protein [Patescibacteria group bacterium]